MILKGNSKYNQAFLNSVDHPKYWKEIKIEIKEELKIYAKANHHLFDDNAPVLKYFDRSNNKTKIILKGEYRIVVLCEDDEEYGYIFSNGSWYEFSLLRWQIDSIEEI